MTPRTPCIESADDRARTCCTPCTPSDASPRARRAPLWEGLSSASCPSSSTLLSASRRHWHRRYPELQSSRLGATPSSSPLSSRAQRHSKMIPVQLRLVLFDDRAAKSGRPTTWRARWVVMASNDPVIDADVDEDSRVSSREPPEVCLLYTSPSPRDQRGSRMPSSA